MKSNIEREKALAFSRLLGLIYSDGTINVYPNYRSEDKNSLSQLQAAVYAGHLIDADIIVNDIELITGKRPSIREQKKDHSSAKNKSEEKQLDEDKKNTDIENVLSKDKEYIDETNKDNLFSHTYIISI